MLFFAYFCFFRFVDSIMGSNPQFSEMSSSVFLFKNDSHSHENFSSFFVKRDFEKYHLLLSTRRFCSAQWDLEHSGVSSHCRKSLQQVAFNWNWQKDSLTILSNRIIFKVTKGQKNSAGKENKETDKQIDRQRQNYLKTDKSWSDVAHCCAIFLGHLGTEI